MIYNINTCDNHVILDGAWKTIHNYERAPVLMNGNIALLSFFIYLTHDISNLKCWCFFFFLQIHVQDTFIWTQPIWYDNQVKNITNELLYKLQNSKYFGFWTNTLYYKILHQILKFWNHETDIAKNNNKIAVKCTLSCSPKNKMEQENGSGIPSFQFETKKLP